MGDNCYIYWASEWDSSEAFPKCGLRAGCCVHVTWELGRNKCEILGPQLTPAESEKLGVGPSHLYVNKPPGRLVPIKGEIETPGL